MAKELLISHQEPGMLVGGKQICVMEMVCVMIKMVMFMRVSIQMTKDKEMASFRWLMGITIKANGKMIYITGMGYWNDLMGIDMMVVG